MNPQDAGRKLLNPRMLARVVSTVVERQTADATGANNIACLYVSDKRSMETLQEKLQECTSAVLWKARVSLYGPAQARIGEMEPTVFNALLEHSRLAIPKVVIGADYDDVGNLKLTGVEWLKLVVTTQLDVDQMVRILDENKHTLKTVLGVPEALFERLPAGLVLDVFSPCSLVNPCDVKIPSLDTKVFKYELNDKETKIPLDFVVDVNADEIQLQVDQLHQLHLRSSRPATNREDQSDVTTNRRIKKMRVEFIGEQASYLDYGKVLRQLAEWCPRLERLELFHAKHFYEGWNKAGYHYVDIVRALDKLVVAFENALVEAESVPFEVHLKTHFWYNYEKEEILPEATDFECGLINNGPPLFDGSTEHACFVKDVSVGRNSIRVDCEIIKGMKSSESTYFENMDHAALSQ